MALISVCNISKSDSVSIFRSVVRLPSILSCDVAMLSVTNDQSTDNNLMSVKEMNDDSRLIAHNMYELHSQ